ncbi:MAG: hypothetical protein AAF961_11750, partial [Planctomycetota bacterium]
MIPRKPLIGMARAIPPTGIAMIAVLLPAVGCWQEIRYDPGRYAAQRTTAVVQRSPSDQTTADRIARGESDVADQALATNTRSSTSAETNVVDTATSIGTMPHVGAAENPSDVTTETSPSPSLSNASEEETDPSTVEPLSPDRQSRDPASTRQEVVRTDPVATPPDQPSLRESAAPVDSERVESFEAVFPELAEGDAEQPAEAPPGYDASSDDAVDEIPANEPSVEASSAGPSDARAVIDEDLRGTIDTGRAAPDLSFLTEPTQAEKRAVWLAASRWSLAAAIYAKGLDQSRWKPVLEDALAAARELALNLPLLPEKTASPSTNLKEAVVAALEGETAEQLV